MRVFLRFSDNPDLVRKFEQVLSIEVENVVVLQIRTLPFASVYLDFHNVISLEVN